MVRTKPGDVVTAAARTEKGEILVTCSVVTYVEKKATYSHVLLLVRAFQTPCREGDTFPLQASFVGMAQQVHSALHVVSLKLLFLTEENVNQHL